MQRIVAILGFMPLVLAAESFDVPAGKVKRHTLSEAISSYPAEVVCEYDFREIRFDDEWGPGFIVTIRSQDESKPFFQLRSQVTKQDGYHVFSYRQGFDEGVSPWDINYLITPYSHVVIRSKVIIYGNGVLDFSTSVGGEIFGSGRIVSPGLSNEKVLLNISSAAGSYSCEVL